MPLSTLVLAPVAVAKSIALPYAWPALVDISRSAILSLLRNIHNGQLRVTDVDGIVTTCGHVGSELDKPVAELLVSSDAFWVRMALFADMGFAESYMLGEVSCPDLTSFFELFILNKAYLSNGSTLISSISNSVSYLARKTNTLANAQLHISAHYDISNAMFAAFLSPDMTYSCPIWDLTTEDESLQAAQERKIQYAIDSARIKSTDHVLEIGTGWGSFAIQAVKTTGCRVTSLTLSVEQKELAEQRIRAAGVADRIEVLLCDYRKAPLPSDRKPAYDKIVSIEMLEAVGHEFLHTYFECVDRLLKKDGGIAVFQCITIPEERYDAYRKSTDFIRAYIFPGGHLPTASQLVSSITTASRKRLIVDSLRNIGPHYAKTLRLWRDSFLRKFESDIKPALLKEHQLRNDRQGLKEAGKQEMGKKEIELFRRKWEYYFTYCEAGFRTCTIGDVVITVVREGSVELMEGVPL